MTATASPVREDNRSPESKRVRLRGPRLAFGALVVVTALLLILPASSLADHAPPVCTSNQQQGTLCLTVSDKTDPVAYSTFDGNSAWLSYHALVSNASRSSSLSHVGLTEALPAGTTFVSATPSKGSCTGSAQSVACTIGSLKKGQSATVDVVVTAPATLDPDPPDITISNVVSATFDERLSDQNGGKQDTAVYVEPTTVSKTAGQAYIPSGRTGKVGSDPAESQYASSLVPEASTDLLAAIQVGPTDTFCVDGKVTIKNKNYICRSGGFVEASVTEAATGATYSNAQHPIVFHLRWDGSLVSDKQTEKNFVVFYKSTATAPVQVFDAPCNAADSNTPCVKNVTLLSDGGIAADFVKDSNGRMR
jgi:uncharacterized repeat protein (TIGR01451 family)